MDSEEECSALWLSGSGASYSARGRGIDPRFGKLFFRNFLVDLRDRKG